MEIETRKASQADIKDIKVLLSFYYLDSEKVENNLEGFTVATLDNKVVGCACLDMEDIVELQSVAVLPGHRNKSIGSRLVDAILNRAAGRTDAVYIRTTSAGFFEKKGFQRLQNDQKRVIWRECNECDKFDMCRQTLMKINIK